MQLFIRIRAVLTQDEDDGCAFVSVIPELSHAADSRRANSRQNAKYDAERAVHYAPDGAALSPHRNIDEKGIARDRNCICTAYKGITTITGI